MKTSDYIRLSNTIIMTNERKFPLKMLFRAMPEDVYKALIVRQAKEKLRLNRMVSLEQTAYRMIKEAANNKPE